MAGLPRTYYRNHTVNDTTTADSGRAGDTVLSIQTLGFSAPEGYTFNEWNTARDGSGTSVAVGEVSEADVLYAIWGRNSISYLTTDQELTSIADAIRSKGGTSAALEYPSEFVSAIEAMPSGSGVTTASFGNISYTTIYYTNANMQYTTASGELAGATAPVGSLVVCYGLSAPTPYPMFGLTQRATWGSKTSATTIYEVTG